MLKMTMEDLEKLKLLAFKSHPFGEFENITSDEVCQERMINNAQFLIAAKNFVPILINELLELREGCELEEVSENEADTINIYEQEVHITNNYTTNYVDMESIEKLIDKKLNESFKPMKACCNE